MSVFVRFYTFLSVFRWNPISSLWQGRTGFALPTIQYSRVCSEDTQPLDKGLSAARQRTEVIALLSEASHVSLSRGRGDCEAFGRALRGFPWSAKPFAQEREEASKKVAGCKVASCAFWHVPKTQPATRNFFWVSFGVRVRVCVPYIYKIKNKKIIYYIELHFMGLIGQVKMQLKNENATGLRVALFTQSTNLHLWLDWCVRWWRRVSDWADAFLSTCFGFASSRVDEKRNPQLFLKIVFWGVGYLPIIYDFTGNKKLQLTLPVILMNIYQSII